jgi:hypothetical protein
MDIKDSNPQKNEETATSRSTSQVRARENMPSGRENQFFFVVKLHFVYT